MRSSPFGWRLYAGAGATYGALMFGLGAIDVPWESPWSVAASAGFFAALGAICIANWTACRALHCLVSGGGYVVLAGTAALVALGPLVARHAALWLLFGVTVATGLVVERVAAGRSDG